MSISHKLAKHQRYAKIRRLLNRRRRKSCMRDVPTTRGIDNTMSSFENSFGGDDIRRLLRPRIDTPAERARARLTELALKVRIRAHLRRAGMRIESVIESAVDRTMHRALADAAHAERIGTLDSHERTLQWIFFLADKAATAELKSQDDALIEQSLNTDVDSLAQRLASASVEENRAAKLTATRVGRGDDDHAAALHECVRHTISTWLATGRRASRHAAIAMYLRFEFTDASRLVLAHSYKRESKDAVGQRNHATRKELWSITRHCFERYASDSASQHEGAQTGNPL